MNKSLEESLWKLRIDAEVTIVGSIFRQSERNVEPIEGIFKWSMLPILASDLHSRLVCEFAIYSMNNNKLLMQIMGENDSFHLMQINQEMIQLKEWKELYQ